MIPNPDFQMPEIGEDNPFLVQQWAEEAIRFFADSKKYAELYRKAHPERFDGIFEIVRDGPVG